MGQTSERVQLLLQLGQCGADGQFLGADALAFSAADAVAGFFGVREVGRPLLFDGVFLAEHGKFVPDALHRSAPG